MYETRSAVCCLRLSRKHGALCEYGAALLSTGLQTHGGIRNGVVSCSISAC